MFKEFKKFAIKGNAVDLAIGIVVGAAFTTIVNSLVNDVVNPPLGLLLGNLDLTNYVITIKQASQSAPAVTINYGKFLNALINFLLVAWVMFFVVRSMNKLREREQEKPSAPMEKNCPYCFSNIPIKATRCPNCTSELE